MPELPEVESVVRSLNMIIKWRRIEAVDVHETGVRALGGYSPTLLSEKLHLQVFRMVERRGKFIIFHLVDNPSLKVVAHLRMTGGFFYQKDGVNSNLLNLNSYINTSNQKVHKLSSQVSNKIPDSKYYRIRIKLDIGELIFTDKRRFGTFHVVENLENYPGLQRLGVEAIAPGFNASYLLKRLLNKTKPIYNSLLDQSIVAGVGNIYACEALIRARLHPLQPSGSVSAGQLAKLVAGLKKILELAILSNGTTFSDFKGVGGEKGEFQGQLLVYGKTTADLDGRHYKVAKLKISGRNAHYIPELQILK